MLLKSLVDYSERLEGDEGTETLPPGYQKVGVRWLIHLDEQGQVTRAAARTSDEKSQGDRARLFTAPSLVRAASIKAKLLVDNGEYTLGIARDGVDADKVAERHEAYKRAVEACAETTHLPEVRAVQRFLEDPNVETLELPKDFDPAENLTFMVNGTRPIDSPEVRRYWSETGRTAGKDAKNALTAECLISGETGKVMDREPVKIKGIPGGQTSGMNLISANEAVYESYGLSASQIAPVLPQYAEKYANALNALLKDRKTHLRVGSLVYVFWTRRGEIPPVPDLLSNPTGENAELAALFSDEEMPVAEMTDRPEQVRRTIGSVWTGRTSESMKDDAFFAAAFSASGSRVVVRDHIETTVGRVRENLRRYFASQALTDSDGKRGTPLGLYALAAGLYRDANKELVPNVPVALVAFALKETPLPYSFLDQLIKRNRAERRVTRPRAVLTKMVLASLKEDMIRMESLVRDRPEVSYHLGRLLAALDSLQYAALGKVNATMVDRFYGSFSTAPESVFGRLMQSSQDHLSKIRKNKPGAHTNAQKRLQEILTRISDVPGTLGTKDQALFSLGYYHERADYWAALTERMEQQSEENA
ncbi:MAG: type I-C CRISPR-associated protein Cas8c/Csd1 [Trueperaceae bacterium]